MIIKNRSLISKYNGKKGGRPKQNNIIKIELSGIDLVILTPAQYNSLIEKYGYIILNKAIKILDNWLKSGSKPAEKYIGKNNYAHFRSDGWVVNMARNYTQE